LVRFIGVVLLLGIASRSDGRGELPLRQAKPVEVKEWRIIAAVSSHLAWLPLKAPAAKPGQEKLKHGFVLRTQAEMLAALTREMTADEAEKLLAKALKVDRINWAEQMLLVPLWGLTRRGAIYGIQIESVQSDGKSLLVHFDLLKTEQPAVGWSIPGGLILVPKFAGDVKFVKANTYDPLPIEIAEVRKAVEKLGGRYVEKGSWHSINLHNARDGELRGLPNIPYPFELRLGPKMTEEALKEMKHFPALTRLSLIGPNWTGKHWKDLESKERLRELHLESAPNVGDVDWKPLSRLTALTLHNSQATGAGLKDLANLRRLSLHFSKKVTDESLSNLSGMKKLAFLNLSGTSITDAGLRNLAGLEELAELHLESTAVTGAGLKELKGLKKLTRIDLSDSRAADEGIKGLQGMTGLADLRLIRTKISDASIPVLCSLTGLRILHLENTHVSEAGGRTLQKALPNCFVSVKPLP
jgi:hypothetical protein